MNTACEDPAVCGDDLDGDGFTEADGDCDDGDASANPSAEELCDGLDNDCDGLTDEDLEESTSYPDQDGDGYGDAAGAVSGCAQPEEGWTPVAEDCDDGDADVNPSAEERCNGRDDDCDGETDEDSASDAGTWYTDADADGYGDDGAQTVACEAPTGAVARGGDCDDADDRYHPDATEDDCTDPNDYNCDGSVGYADADGDGWAACAECDDGDPSVSPSELEWCDGIDNNCDGAVDEDSATDAGTWYADSDGDGFGDADSSTLACEAPSGFVADDTDCDDDDGAVSPAGEEVCNGLDDNCDGNIDEDSAADAGTWYADSDGDGFGDADSSTLACEAPSGFVADDTDCDDSRDDVSPDATDHWYDDLDADCDGDDNPSVCDEVPGLSAISSDPTCTVSLPDPADWSHVVEWTSEDLTYSAGTSYTRIMMTPVVGQVNDDNGDGLIDENDIPDIAYTTFKSSGYTDPGYLRVMSGDGSGELWSVYSVSSGSTRYPGGVGGVAIGDLEGDGSPDVVVSAYGGYLIALENDGSLKWVSSDASANLRAYPQIVDLDGDGEAEIIAYDTVFDTDGSTLFTLATDGAEVTHAIDLDGDGDMEIIGGGVLYDHTGTEVWDSGYGSARTAEGDFDGDGLGEIILHSGTTVVAIDDDGATLWSATLSGGGNGAPCVGDLDADGEPEAVAAGGSTISAYDADGTKLWSNTIRDTSSSSASCAMFDFNGDGAEEVVYADEYDLWVFDGLTGDTLLRETSHASGTVRENPVIADVDNDGQAEIVLPTNDYARSGWDGLYVLGEENGAWQSARPVWNQHAYHISNVEDDSAIPAVEPTPWSEGFNSFRAQRSWSGLPGGAARGSAVVLGSCADEVAGTVTVYVSVDSDGAVFLPAGVSVTLYAVNGSTLSALDTQHTDAVLWPGERSAPLEFVIDAADAGSDGYAVAVDSEDAVRECDD